MIRLLVLLLIALIPATGCDNYPKDAENTLVRVQNSHVLRVGLIEDKPWAHKGRAQPEGIDVQIILDFAQTLNARPQWQFLPEAEATEKLKNHELDLVIGGLTQASPRKKELGFTRPYLKTGDDRKDRHVMAGAQGENRFITTLEKFLKSHKAEIQKLYLLESGI